MRRMRNLARGAALAALLAIALAACGGYSYPGGNDQQPEQPQAQQPGPTSAQPDAAIVQVANTDLGAILSDATGRTLYAFTKDGRATGRSACEGECIATWPAMTASGTPLAGGGVDASLLTTIQRSDGTAQVTYNGWPLYFYGADVQPGQTQGQGVGGVWFVVSPQGKLVRGPAGAGAAGDASTGSPDASSGASDGSGAANGSGASGGYGY
jgi:predicted lipoprotein with Yx(FWY)xxD motif